MTQDDLALMYEKANGWNPAPYKITMEELERFSQLAVAHEREACAKIADEWAVGWPHPSTVIAEQIRARGNT